MTRMLVLACALLVGACATTEAYERMLNNWVGAQEIDLVRAWGPPVRTYETGGHKFLLFETQQVAFVPGTPPIYQTYMVGNRAVTTAAGGSPPMNVFMSCATTFELDAGKVVAWTHKGNDCRARE